MYEDYLRLFPKTKFAYELTFQLGDLYYKLEEFDKAATAYKTTVLADPKGKYMAEAAHDNILAVEEHLKDVNPPRPKSSKTALEIHPLRKRLIEACDRYMDLVPREKTKNVSGIQFKAAKMFYDHSHFDTAIKRFSRLVDEFPGEPEAEFAANLIIDIYNLREDWKNLYETSVAYLKNETLIKGRDKLRGDLSKYAEYASFKRIEILEDIVKKENGDLSEVARAYEKFQAEFPKSENADDALYNASVAWDTSGSKERANKLRKVLMKDYKDSPLVPDVTFYIARSFEDRAEYRKAAKLLSAFAEKHPTDKRARDAMFNAAVFYAGVGKVVEANKLREEYLKKYGTNKEGKAEAASIYFSIARDLERAGKLSTAAKRYEEFVDKFRSDDRIWEALWHTAQIYRKLRRNSSAEKVEGKIFGTYRARKKKREKMPPTAADYASRIAFENLEEAMRKYRRIRIPRPNLRRIKLFQKGLDEKAKARETVIKQYTKIVTDYQQAYSSIASLYTIAKAWDYFVESLLKVPCPKGLNTEQCDFFRQGLEEKIAPAQQSAYQAFQTCVKKSQELNTFTTYSTKCVAELEKRAPGEFPPIIEKQLKYTPPKADLVVTPNALILKARASKKKPQPSASLEGSR